MEVLPFWIYLPQDYPSLLQVQILVDMRIHMVPEVVIFPLFSFFAEAPHLQQFIDTKAQLQSRQYIYC